MTLSLTADDAWLEIWLSAPRFARYFNACDMDAYKALQLYEWNLKLGQALMRDIAHVEVALRNAYERVMSDLWQGDHHWLLDKESPVQSELLRKRSGRLLDLNKRNRQTLNDARRRLRLKNGQVVPTDRLIAELSFGFWRHCTDAAHEKTLWVPYLHKVFPAGTDRNDVAACLQIISIARNRVSHHEPLFDSGASPGVLKAHSEVIRVAAWLLPELHSYIRETTAFQSVLAERP